MSSTYPGAIDPTSLTDTTRDHGDVEDALFAVQTELGVNPSGSAVTVADRFAALPAAITVVSRTAAYTAVAGDYVLASGTFVVTLPAATAGTQVTVVNTGAGTITVAGASGALINGDPNASLVSRGAGGTFTGNGSSWWVPMQVGDAAVPTAPPDTTAPTVPTNLAVSPGNTQNVLSWTASTDAVGVASYRVRRGGTLIASPTATTYTDTGRTNGTSYSYTVSAVDAAGNESAQTATVSGTPVATPTTPNAPTIGTATAADGIVSVAFTAPTSNGVTITGYRVTRTPGGATQTGANSPISIASADGVAATFTVAANSAGGYGPESAASNSVTPAAASTFTDPTSLTGLSLWADATQITGTANGAQLAQWNDLSGGAKHLAQATAVNQPRFYNASPPAGVLPNGKPVVYFGQAGGNNWLDSPALDLAVSTIFLVVQDINTVNSTLVDKAAAGTGRVVAYRETTGALTLFAGSVIATAADAATYPPTVFAFTVNGAGSSIHRNGAQVASGNPGSAALGSMRLAGNQTANSAGRLTGSMSEVVVYNRALSAAERQQVESYLKTKWGTP